MHLNGKKVSRASRFTAIHAVILPKTRTKQTETRVREDIQRALDDHAAGRNNSDLTLNIKKIHPRRFELSLFGNGITTAQVDVIEEMILAKTWDFAVRDGQIVE